MSKSSNKDMKRSILYCFLLLLYCTASATLCAQSDKQAKQIVSDYIRSIEHETVKAAFSFTTTGGDLPEQSQQGTLTLKGDKFVLQMEGIAVFFDGKTQWTYLEANNEVSITEPDRTELSETNPFLVLKEYQGLCDMFFSQAHKTEGYQTIEMHPRTADPNVSNIIVQFSNNGNTLKSIRIESGNGLSVQIGFSNIEKGLNIPDSTFVFNKQQYEGVFENDLR